MTIVDAERACTVRVPSPSAVATSYPRSKPAPPMRVIQTSTSTPLLVYVSGTRYSTSCRTTRVPVSGRALTRASASIRPCSV